MPYTHEIIMVVIIITSFKTYFLDGERRKRRRSKTLFLLATQCEKGKRDLQAYRASIPF